MFDLIPYALAGLAIGMVGAFIGTKAVRLILDRRERKQDMDCVPEKVKLSLFCRDCGQRYQTTRSQDGFSRQTGQPIYNFALRCPDWTVTSYNARLATYVGSMGGFLSPGARGGMETDCGKRKVSSTVGAHNHDDPNEDSMKCPACIDVLFRAGALTEPDARKLYLEAGVR